MYDLTILALPLALLFSSGNADDGAEKAKHHGKIMQLDEDGNGSISKAEAAGTRLAERFDSIDANKDGSLTKAELKAAHGGKRHRSPEQRFAKLDANGDGSVTLAEMKAAHAKHEQRRAERGESSDKSKRKGDDAKRDRPRPTPEQRFAKLDANGDGGVTLAEMKAAHAKRDGKKGKGKNKSK